MSDESDTPNGAGSDDINWWVVGLVTIIAATWLLQRLDIGGADGSPDSGRSAAEKVDVQIDGCHLDGADGWLVNETGDTLDVYVEISYFDMPANESIGWGNDTATIRPDGRARFRTSGVEYYPDGRIECDVTDLSARPT